MLSDAERMLALFAGNDLAHGTHGVPVYSDKKNKWEIHSTARTLRQPVTVELWEQHLTGKTPLGIIATRPDGTCVWGSADIDKYDGSTQEIPARVARAAMPLVPCVSKSGGIHLFLFTSSPVPVERMQAALRAMTAELGLSGCEIFPKQTRILVDKGDTGNWMAVPYFGGTFDGRLREQVGIRVGGGGMELSEFLRVSEAARLSPEELDVLTTPRHRSKKNGANGAHVNGATGSAAADHSDEPFWDGPPCLQNLASVGVGAGGQNNALLMMGIYLKKAHSDQWETRLRAMASSNFFDPPVRPDDPSLEGVIRSLRRKEYEYTCQQEPMRSHCDSARCRTRRHGVGGGGGVPVIAGLSKLETEPAIWFVDVEGSRIEISTRELLDYRLFQIACAEHLTILPHVMKQDQWIMMVSAAMTEAVRIDPPPDAVRGYALSEMIEEFLVNRHPGDSRDDLMSGRVYHNEEDDDASLHRHEFVLADLLRFLRRESHRDASRGNVTRHVEKIMSGGSGFYNLRGRGLNFWWVPDSSLRKLPPAETPRIREREA